MFLPVLNQMAFLFSLIALGYLLSKLRLVPENTGAVLSKLENYLFVPALVLGTFLGKFTVDTLSSAGSLLLFSLAVEAVVIPLAFLCSRLCSKDGYIRKIFTYGLCFSNFGFMGNAVVSAVFPEIFLEYVIFTLALWIAIYLWGVPCLLMEGDDRKGLAAKLKNFLNPMFVCAIVGMVMGLLQVPVPRFANDVIASLGNCMSPVAMLITGMTIARIDLKKVLRMGNIYIVSLLRLLMFPLLFLLVYRVLGLQLPEAFLVCSVASLAMPLGLNTVVIPSAYGRDTTVAAGMALISHVLSILTIPIIFSLL